MKRFLQHVPQKYRGKVGTVFHDQGKEFEGLFVEALNDAGIKNKKTLPGAPAKHIESFNAKLREASVKFRTKYDTKRIKDFIPVLVRRMNN